MTPEKTDVVLGKKLTFADVLAQAPVNPEFHRVEIPSLGGYIEFADLSLDDMDEIYRGKPTDQLEIARRTLYVAWHKADPTVTLEGVKKGIKAEITLQLVAKIVPAVLTGSPFGTSQTPQSGPSAAPSKT